jgi:hypothetical protein
MFGRQRRVAGWSRGWKQTSSKWLIDMTTKHGGSESPEILFHLRWVANIALSVGALTATGLGVVLFVLTDRTGASYGELIKSASITHENLGPALLIGGLALVAFTAILTWLISLYSSFLIAGPLFRLSRNIEASLTEGPIKPLPIRDSDRLHREAAMLDDALGALALHYKNLRDEVDRALGQIDAGEISADDRRILSAHLKGLIERART